MLKSILKAAALAVLLSAQLPGLSLDELLARHAEALGGEQALRQFESFHYQAEVTLGGLKGTAEAFFAEPDRARTIIDLGILKVEQGCRQGRYWIKDQTGTLRDMAGAELRQAITENYFNNYAYVLDPALRAYMTAPDSANYGGLSCYHIQFDPPDGQRTQLYFDHVTFMPVGYSLQIQGLEVKVTLSDWRVAEGIKFPFSTIQDLGNPMLSTSIQLTGLDVNIDIPDAQFAPPSAARGLYAFADSSLSTMVSFDLKGFHIYLPVSVNGHGPFWFILDSGAGMTILSRRLADSLGLADAGNMPAIGVGGLEVGSFCRVDSLSVGGLRLYDLTAGKLDFTSLDSLVMAPIAGILGYELFSRLIVELNYSTETLKVIDPAATYSGGADTLALEVETNHPIVTATVNDSLPGRFRVDTGSFSFLDLNGPFVKRFDLLRNADTSFGTVPLAGIGGASTATLAKLPSFTLGKARLENLLTGLSRSDSGIMAADGLDGNIGGGVLSQFRVAFDYPHHSMYLTHTGESPSATHPDVGLVLAPDGDGFRVYSVETGTPAARSGLQEGDKVVAIDGETTTGLTLNQVYARLSGGDGRKIEVRVERAGKLRTCKLISRKPS